MSSKLLEKFSHIRIDIRGKRKSIEEGGKSGQVVLVAGFIVTLVMIGGLLVWMTRSGYQQPQEKLITEENLFELQLEESVNQELHKGLSSFRSAVYDKHLEGIYHDITEGFIPFGVDVYEVLSNKKDGTATLKENQNERVMAGNQVAEKAAEEGQKAPAEPVTEAPAEPVTEAPTEPVTEAPTEPVTEAPTEPVTEAPTEPVTEPPTEPVTEPVTEAVVVSQEDSYIEISGDTQQSYRPGEIVYGDFYGEEAGMTASGGTGYSYDATGDEYYWLYQITEAEAGDQDEIGKILVVNVILNRVYSGSFPNSIQEVIFQSRGSVYQFQPVKNGRIYSVVPSSNTVSCVNRALNGEDYSDGALYFAMKTSKYSWFNTALTFLFVHGDHYFYR